MVSQTHDNLNPMRNGNKKTSFRLARDDYFVAVHIKAQSPAVNKKLKFSQWPEVFLDLIAYC